MSQGMQGRASATSDSSWHRIVAQVDQGMDQEVGGLGVQKCVCERMTNSKLGQQGPGARSDGVLHPCVSMEHPHKCRLLAYGSMELSSQPAQVAEQCQLVCMHTRSDNGVVSSKRVRACKDTSRGERLDWASPRPTRMPNMRAAGAARYRAHGQPGHAA